MAGLVPLTEGMQKSYWIMINRDGSFSPYGVGVGVAGGGWGWGLGGSECLFIPINIMQIQPSLSSAPYNWYTCRHPSAVVIPAGQDGRLMNLQGGVSYRWITTKSRKPWMNEWMKMCISMYRSFVHLCVCASPLLCHVPPFFSTLVLPMRSRRWGGGRGSDPTVWLFACLFVCVKVPERPYAFLTKQLIFFSKKTNAGLNLNPNSLSIVTEQ